MTGTGNAARRLRHWILSEPMSWTTENDLQNALDTRLTAEAGRRHPITHVRREVRLDDHNRIDFLVALAESLGGESSTVGVEVKIKGSAKDVLRQLTRYAAIADIDELLLVTTKAAHHRMPAELNGKPVIVCSLVEAGL